MAINQDILKNYIEKVLTLKNRQEITAGDLRSIALELGITEQDFNEIEKTVQEHRVRGSNYLLHKCWDDAIDEYEDALALNPMNARLFYELAAAYYARGMGQHAQVDLKKAEDLAKECIHYTPADKEAYALLRKIHEQTAGAFSVEKRKKIRVRVIITGLVFFLSGLIYLLNFNEKQKPAHPLPGDEMVSAEIRGDVEQTHASSNGQQVPETIPRKRNLPVKIMSSEETGDLKINIRESILNPFDNSFSYVLKADIMVEKIRLKELAFRVALTAKGGEEKYVDFMQAQEDYRPAVLPGNTLPANILMYYKEKDPGLTGVVISVSFIQKEPYVLSGVQYPEKTLSWLIPKPADITLRVVERQNSLSASFDSSYHLLVFEVTNTGTRSLEILKLRVDWWDENGQEIGSEGTYVTSVQDSSFRPGQTRVGYVIRNFKDRKPAADRYKVQVLEIR